MSSSYVGWPLKIVVLLFCSPTNMKAHHNYICLEFIIWLRNTVQTDTHCNTSPLRLLIRFRVQLPRKKAISKSSPSPPFEVIPVGCGLPLADPLERLFLLPVRCSVLSSCQWFQQPSESKSLLWSNVCLRVTTSHNRLNANRLNVLQRASECKLLLLWGSWLDLHSIACFGASICSQQNRGSLGG